MQTSQTWSVARLLMWLNWASQSPIKWRGKSWFLALKLRKWSWGWITSSELHLVSEPQITGIINSVWNYQRQSVIVRRNIATSQCLLEATSLQMNVLGCILDVVICILCLYWTGDLRTWLILKLCIRFFVSCHRFWYFCCKCSLFVSFSIDDVLVWWLKLHMFHPFCPHVDCHHAHMVPPTACILTVLVHTQSVHLSQNWLPYMSMSLRFCVSSCSESIYEKPLSWPIDGWICSLCYPFCIAIFIFWSATTNMV